MTNVMPPVLGGEAEATVDVLRILVVEDDAVDQRAVRRALTRSGLRHAIVQDVPDAASALALLRGAGEPPAFDCVLLDYNLSDATGLDVLRAMSGRAHGIPVVMLTGQSDPETAAALIKAGAADFLSKDALSPDRLEQAVRGAVRVARAERELQENRERLTITLRSIGDAVITVDLEGRITYLNAAGERLTGWPAAEALRRRLEEVAFVVAADSDGSALRDNLLHQRVRDIIAGRPEERADMTLVARDGQQLYVDTTVTPLRDASGAPTGAVLALRDVTARRRTEEALAQANRRLQDQAEELEQQAEELARSETRYRALVEASAHIIWTTDANGEPVDLTAWCALTGQTADEVRDGGWVDALHPDDRERSAALWREALRARGVFETDYRVRTADGSYRWYRVRGVPVLHERGEVREWVGTLVDIEDEKRAEQAQREETNLVETLHRIGAAVASELDVARVVQTVTDATTALTGAQFGAFFYNVVDKQGEKLTLYTLSGAPREAFSDFGHPRPTPIFAPTFYGTGIVRSDDITKDPRYGRMPPHYGMPPGHLPVRSYLAVPVISRNGEVVGGLFFGHAEPGVFTDRAERLASGIAASAAIAFDNARLYEAERRARAEAEEANKAKAEFLASMSHELRTPLNAIGGYADLLIDGIRGPVTEAQRADLKRIKRSQHHLLSLINDILNFAKIEAGRVRFDLRDVPLSDVLGRLEALIQPQLLQKQLRYSYRGCDPSYTAYVDPERLQQILLNLLSNAVKFTPPGGQITVGCEATPDAIVVRVGDTGVGIPADKLEHIFEPFVQLDRGQTAGSVGTGLGLAISRDLARAMRGDLTAESRLDVGSTFTLTLAAAPARDGRQGAAPEHSHELTGDR